LKKTFIYSGILVCVFSIAVMLFEIYFAKPNYENIENTRGWLVEYVKEGDVNYPKIAFIDNNFDTITFIHRNSDVSDYQKKNFDVTYNKQNPQQAYTNDKYNSFGVPISTMIIGLGLVLIGFLVGKKHQ